MVPLGSTKMTELKMGCLFVGNKNGANAAIEDLGTGAPEPEDHDDLFCDAPGPVSPVKRGRGRPAGVRNKSTDEWRKILLGKYQSPLVGLLEIASRSPKELAEELGMYKSVLVGPQTYKDRLAVGDAFSMQLDALKAALPYLHQKQPLAIEAKGDKRGLLVMGDINLTALSNSGFDLPFADDEENQEVINVTKEKSHGEKSHAQPNQLISINKDTDDH